MEILFVLERFHGNWTHRLSSHRHAGLVAMCIRIGVQMETGFSSSSSPSPDLIRGSPQSTESAGIPRSRPGMTRKPLVSAEGFSDLAVILMPGTVFPRIRPYVTVHRPMPASDPSRQQERCDGDSLCGHLLIEADVLACILADHLASRGPRTELCEIVVRAEQPVRSSGTSWATLSTDTCPEDGRHPQKSVA
jgi:hypothetical protein